MADILSDISQDPDITLHLLGNYIGSAYSPQVEVTETDTGHEVAITYDDATDGITTKTFSVEDGKASTGTGITAVTVSTLDAGADATAALADGTDGQTLALGIPRGAQGVQGPKGDRGETGATGPKGDSYVLTDADKAEIVNSVVETIGTATTGAAGLMSAADKSKLDGIDATKLAAKATTLGGYGITDAYTKAQTDSAIASAIDSKLAALDANSTAY